MLAVIGTAGRREDAARISRALYDAMYRETVETARRWGVNGAISGGAAVADHLAVRAFLEGAVESLELWLPARFEHGAFVPNPRVRFNPGATSNNYHRAFSASCGVDSLGEIAEAIRRGAAVHVAEGFHLRNSEVAARCTHMLAFTFGKGGGEDLLATDEAFSDPAAAGLKDGGTAHTWGECYNARMKRHVNLFALERVLKDGVNPSPVRP